MLSCWGYLRNDLQALPLVAGRSHRVGRKPECDLVLKSRSVSGEHAEITVDEDGKQAHLRDLASLNGCFINNVRLKGQREALRHGDNVRFGFDNRVWLVDCTAAARQPESQPRKRAAGGWDYSAEGAGVSEQRSKAKPPPAQLPSGSLANPAFFEQRSPPRRRDDDEPTALERPAPFDAPFPPEDQLRTSESGGGGVGYAEDDPSGGDPSGGGAGTAGDEAWREEMEALQAKLRGKTTCAPVHACTYAYMHACVRACVHTLTQSCKRSSRLRGRRSAIRSSRWAQASTVRDVRRVRCPR